MVDVFITIGITKKTYGVIIADIAEKFNVGMDHMSYRGFQLESMQNLLKVENGGLILNPREDIAVRETWDEDSEFNVNVQLGANLHQGRTIS